MGRSVRRATLNQRIRHLRANWDTRVLVDDLRASAADANTSVDWRLGYDWRARPCLGIDNLFDHDYVGSLIVNAASGRFYEPVPGRAVFADTKAS